MGPYWREERAERRQGGPKRAAAVGRCARLSRSAPGRVSAPLLPGGGSAGPSRPSHRSSVPHPAAGERRRHCSAGGGPVAVPPGPRSLTAAVGPPPGTAPPGSPEQARRGGPGPALLPAEGGGAPARAGVGAAGRGSPGEGRWGGRGVPDRGGARGLQPGGGTMRAVLTMCAVALFVCVLVSVVFLFFFLLLRSPCFCLFASVPFGHF